MTSSIDKNAPLPIDWYEWREIWDAWRAEHRADLQPSSYRFGPKNFLADEVLGVWRIGSRNVELSEVTFPALGYRGTATRYIGVTFGTAAGSDRPDAPLVATFAELEEALGLDAR